jgi:hypothetical protein
MRSAIMSLLFLAGCGGSYHPCREGTVYITVELDQESAEATHLIITAGLGETKMTAIMKDRAPRPQETLEVELGSGYKAGLTLKVEVVAEKNGAVLGKGSLEKTLDPGCSVATLRVAGTTSPSDGDQTNDLAVGDGTLPDAAEKDLAGIVVEDQGGGDFAQDASTADTSVVASDAASPDLLVGGMEPASVEMAMPVADLTAGAKPDLGMPPDLTGVKFDLAEMDLRTPPDSAPPPDMTLPPDMAASCTDKVKNQDETDVDCGGKCPKCGGGKVCGADSDCTVNWCKVGKCATLVSGYNPGQNPGAPDCASNPNLPIYNCLEACALKFGGVAADYRCSTDAMVVNMMANVNCRGSGCQVGSESFKIVPYGCSAYCTDGCMKSNYCFK